MEIVLIKESAIRVSVVFKLLNQNPFNGKNGRKIIPKLHENGLATGENIFSVLFV